MAHVNGFRAEIEMVNRIVAQYPNEVIVQWGKPVTQNGSDVISVNRLTGEVTLWDSKYRSDRRQIRESGTFRSGSSAYKNARQAAIEAIEASNLPPYIIEQAIMNVRRDILMARTAGAGAARNSTFSQRP